MAFFDRAAWGAKSPRCAISTIDITKRAEFIVHYSTGQELGREDCAGWVREIQAFHQNTRGWCDIGYNFLVCKHGDIFEGRGWNKVGAHAPYHNTIGIGVCFLGNDDPQVPDASPQARAAVKSLLRDLITKSGHEIKVLGHRDVKATACPGNELYNWIGAGMPLEVTQTDQPPASSTFEEADVKVTFVQIELDSDGNGWESVPGKPVSATEQGPYPPADGYWKDQQPSDISVQERDGNTIVVARGGKPLGAIGAYVVTL